MDSTIQFLWDRRKGGRTPDAAQRWAISLLEYGMESDAILRLAGDANTQLVEQLTAQAIRDLGRERLLDERGLLEAYERASVSDYYNGRIDGWNLIGRGWEVYKESRYDSRWRYWDIISDDAEQHGGQGICGTYPFNRMPFDMALKDALARNGLTEAAVSS